MGINYNEKDRPNQRLILKNMYMEEDIQKQQQMYGQWKVQLKVVN